MNRKLILPGLIDPHVHLRYLDPHKEDFLTSTCAAIAGEYTTVLDMPNNNPPITTPEMNFAAVKVPQFSFARLTGADPILHVEMGSTGEVACFGETMEEAFLKGQLAVGEIIPNKGIFISLGGDENKTRFLESVRSLKVLNLPLYGSEKTAAFLKKQGVDAKTLYKIHEKKSPNILEYFQKNKIDLAINIVDSHIKKHIDDDYAIRRFAIDRNIPLFTNLQKAALFIKAITTLRLEDLLIKSWSEYV